MVTRAVKKDRPSRVFWGVESFPVLCPFPSHLLLDLQCLSWERTGCLSKELEGGSPAVPGGQAEAGWQPGPQASLLLLRAARGLLTLGTNKQETDTNLVLAPQPMAPTITVPQLLTGLRLPASPWPQNLKTK